MKRLFQSALPIRHTLLAAFLLAGLLPAMLVTGLAFFEARAALRAEIERDLHTRAAAAAAEIDRMMFERMQNAASWSQLEIMQEVRIGDVDKRLSNFLRTLKTSYQGVYRELYVLDSAGLVIASSDPAQIGRRDRLPATWLAAPLPQGSVLALPLAGGVLPLQADIRDAFSEQRAGSLLVHFDWGQVGQVLANASADGRAAALLDRNGRTLAEVGGWDAVRGGASLYAESRRFSHFPAFGWQVALAQPEHFAFAPVRRMGWIFLLLLTLTAALAVLAAAPVASRIARPLASLTRFARNFMHEQRREAPPATGPAEVRELAAAFAQMIEDLERSRDNLTRAAKLAVVGEMAAAMTHEVRTPIGILRSSAQLLLREPGLSEDGREICNFIISETDRLNRLVSTLLDSARPAAPDMKPGDLAGIARQTATMLTAQALKKNIVLNYAGCAGDVPVLCDEGQLTQVLLNLLLNALQILPEGGHVRVSVARVGAHALLEVADDGPGIAPELRERVFDPFFTQRPGGVGLGLVVVRQIVAAHGGDISITDSDMGGALFRVRLPAIATEETPA